VKFYLNRHLIAIVSVSAILMACGGGGGGSDTSSSLVNVTVKSSQNTEAIVPGQSFSTSGVSVSLPHLMKSLKWTATTTTTGAPALILSNGDCADTLKDNKTVNATSQSTWTCEAIGTAPQNLSVLTTYRLTLSGEDDKGNSSSDYRYITVAPSTFSPVVLAVDGSKTITSISQGQSFQVNGTSTSTPLLMASLGWSMTKMTSGSPDLTISNNNCVIASKSNKSDPAGNTSIWSCAAVVSTSTVLAADATYRITLSGTDTGGNTGYDYRDVKIIATPTPSLAAPTASTPATLTKFSGDDATVNCVATGGTVGPSSAYRFSWQTVSNPSGITISTISPTPSALSFKVPVVYVPTNVTFECRVTDDNLKTGTSDTVLTINPMLFGSTVVVADAGGSQSAIQGAVVTLDGSRSTGSNPLYYTWSQTSGPAVTLDASTSVKPSFMAPTVTQSTTLTFELVAQAAAGMAYSATPSEIDTAVVYVNPYPALMLTMPSAVVVNYGAAAALSVSVNPADTGLYYEWTQISGTNVVLGGANTKTASFIAPSTTGALMFFLKVSRKPIALASPGEIYSSDVIVSITP